MAHEHGLLASRAAVLGWLLIKVFNGQHCSIMSFQNAILAKASGLLFACSQVHVIAYVC